MAEAADPDEMALLNLQLNGAAFEGTDLASQRKKRSSVGIGRLVDITTTSFLLRWDGGSRHHLRQQLLRMIR